MPRAFAACQTVELGSEIRAAGSVTRRAFGGRQGRVAQRERVKAPVVSGDPVLTEHTEPARRTRPTCTQMRPRVVSTRRRPHGGPPAGSGTRSDRIRAVSSTGLPGPWSGGDVNRAGGDAAGQLHD